MPNQRDEEKRKVGVWLDPAEWEALEKIAKELGVTKSDVLRATIEKKLKTEQERKNDSGK
jgi:macrodomain Ter protein organizer (MatP/YcbG family)